MKPRLSEGVSFSGSFFHWHLETELLPRTGGVLSKSLRLFKTASHMALKVFFSKELRFDRSLTET